MTILLTPRQREVLQLLAEGHETKEIAATLGIRFGTVKNHINALLSRFGARNRTHLVALGLRSGVIA